MRRRRRAGACDGFCSRIKRENRRHLLPGPSGSATVYIIQHYNPALDNDSYVRASNIHLANYINARYRAPGPAAEPKLAKIKAHEIRKGRAA